MPTVTIDFDDDEMAALRDAADSSGRSPEEFAHAAVVAAAADFDRQGGR
ncbi:hypothetical protein [Antrihabitans cavernicola]|nr:hypothetical protein [Spelaeibacter cavernicola]